MDYCRICEKMHKVGKCPIRCRICGGKHLTPRCPDRCTICQNEHTTSEHRCCICGNISPHRLKDCPDVCTCGGFHRDSDHRYGPKN